MIQSTRHLSLALVVSIACLAGCGKSGKDAPKSAEQQRTEREAYEQKREERAMQNPDQVFGKALKSQETASKRSEAHRKKVVDDAQKRYEDGDKNSEKSK